MVDRQCPQLRHQASHLCRGVGVVACDIADGYSRKTGGSGSNVTNRYASPSGTPWTTPWLPWSASTLAV